MKLPIPRPASDTPAVRALCSELVPGGVPDVLRIDAPQWAKVDNCTENIKSVIALHGGTAEYGWQLMETIPDVLLEAEFHAVWVDQESSKHEVTPKIVPGWKQVVFLPDPELVYEGHQIDNVRRPLVHDPLVDEFIKAAEDYFEATNRGDLADYHGPLAPSREIQTIQKRQERLHLQILTKYFS